MFKNDETSKSIIESYLLLKENREKLRDLKVEHCSDLKESIDGKSQNIAEYMNKNSEEKTKLIYDFIKFADSSACVPFCIYIHEENEKVDINFIRKWVEENE